MKPKIYFKNGYWRVSPKPNNNSKSNLRWRWAHHWINSHNTRSTPEERRMSPWRTV